ncbi:MAG: DUF493 domain-containing protein [Candidatus Pelagadaptatus aseana]|uniref:YbeD family protein n=1 Tax=Candidatus Pelagadaptatus aseana TaxID=3120508 RepID=UPI0039B1CED6
MSNNSNTSAPGQPEPPKIEFPCPDYPIKVMGEAGDEYYQFVIDVMQRHAPGFDPAKVGIKESRNGSFQSITFFITATGVDQLEALHNELRANSKTKMVL